MTQGEVLCALAAKDPRYAPFCDGRPAADADPPEPCRFRGRELDGSERGARGLGHGRRWSLCLHEARPLGEAVCPCRGCGPRCGGYSAS